ncbi:restriction endonuclease [Nocardia salmonicida]|uniref:restriction endonuclease n=1 Tax=Nocardia salmonicida TaxID=53431 RepID=UPI003653DAA9
MPTDDQDTWLTARFPDPDISPAEFEEWVVELFQAVQGQVDNLQVNLHEKIQGVDGEYDFDATVRFEFAGMTFLVIVEAKHHNHPIKRDVVSVLKDKMHSVGAHKGIIVATAPFQKGAVEYAKVHGIALLKVTEGRFTYETKAAEPPPALTRKEATELMGVPVFVAHAYTAGSTPDSTLCTLVSTRDVDHLAETLLGINPD